MSALSKYACTACIHGVILAGSIDKVVSVFWLQALRNAVLVINAAIANFFICVTRNIKRPCLYPKVSKNQTILYTSLEVACFAPLCIFS